MTIDGKEFPVEGKVYSDTEALLQLAPFEFRRETTDKTNAVYIKQLMQDSTAWHYCDVLASA